MELILLFIKQQNSLEDMEQVLVVSLLMEENLIGKLVENWTH